MPAMQRPILPRYRRAYSYPRAIPYIFTVSVLPQSVFPLPLSRSRSPLRFRISLFLSARTFKKIREVRHVPLVTDLIYCLFMKFICLQLKSANNLEIFIVGFAQIKILQFFLYVK